MKWIALSLLLLLLLPQGCSAAQGPGAGHSGKPGNVGTASQRPEGDAESVMKARYAGQFYPADAGELRTVIGSYLRAVPPRRSSGSLYGLISPHAGYVYSGSIAAYGYKEMRPSTATAIVLAPTHHYHLKGAAMIQNGSFETPLGKIPINSDVASRLLSLTEVVKENKEPFAGEHSLEVQLPFLQYASRDITIVPLITGECTPAQVRELAHALASVFTPGTMVMVASSDMSHYHSYQEALKIDGKTISMIEKMDIARLQKACKKGASELCGSTPVEIVMTAMHEMGGKPEILKYANSGYTAGGKDRVVGYMSVAFRGNSKKEAKKLTEEEFITQEDKKMLLSMARKTLEEYLRTGKEPEFFKDSPIPENLKKESGMFVTLRKNHDLRGCIGYILGRDPLYRAVSELAVSSATRDPRFPPVTCDELKDIHIEISVMSPLKRVKNADEIVMGKHGVYVKKGFYSGIFLPQVATETGWDKETFMRHLCADKAGLPADAWKDPGTELHIFTADIFEE